MEWVSNVAEAEEVEERLRPRLDLANAVTRPTLVAGLDVSYEVGTDRVVAAAVMIDLDTLQTTESALFHSRVEFPYVPGLLGFREAPLLLEALSRLATTPEVLVCDGYGIAHPRRFGLACHLGVLTGLPSMGVAKTPFTGSFEPPGRQRGDWSPLVEGEETLGYVLRTQPDVKPVFVSVGHRIGIQQAHDVTLRSCGRFRLPETTRRADFLSREALRRS